ncbi:hypothetical protein PHMEG_0009526 [Phytophthora megakarya]|uniref:Uncharacterized protein n=1 Tax=Phytophthora megakarya TaxID=4795 RepID=A0A225WGY1_9STRA|nr:hypothetical protein PHMEG_0009526 [Phytophthora megakarya]
MVNVKLIVERWGVKARHGEVLNAYVKAVTEAGMMITLYVQEGLIVTKERLDELGRRLRMRLIIQTSSIVDTNQKYENTS